MFLAHVNLIIAVFTVAVVFQYFVAVVFKYKAETKRLGFKYPPDHGETYVYDCNYYDTIFVSLVGFQMLRQSHGQSILILENREKSKHAIKKCTRISHKKLLRIHGKHCHKEL